MNKNTTKKYKQKSFVASQFSAPTFLKSTYKMLKHSSC